VADGRYDISDLLDEWMKPKEEPDTGTPRFSLNNIQLIGGKIVFDDQPKGKVHTISEINLALPFVSSLPYQAEVQVEPSFSAQINGSQLALKGRSKPFSGTHESELDLDLDRFDLAPLQAYLPDNMPVRLASGTVDSELKIVFKELADQVFSLSVVGSAHLNGLSVSESGGQKLVSWKKLDVDLENADLINRNFAVKRVANSVITMPDWLPLAATFVRSARMLPKPSRETPPRKADSTPRRASPIATLKGEPPATIRAGLSLPSPAPANRSTSASPPTRIIPIGLRSSSSRAYSTAGRNSGEAQLFTRRRSQTRKGW